MESTHKKETIPIQKAWEVTDEELGSAIVFAATEDEAAEMGARELASDTECVTAVYVPEYDHYAHQGYVPIKELYDNYWYFNCWHCDRRVSLLDDEDEDEEGNRLDPVFEEKRLFCSARCQKGFYETIQKRNKQREAAKNYLLKKFPEIKLISIYGGLDNPVSVFFKFPGGKHDVQWFSDDPGIVLVTRQDQEAWRAYRKS